jgi:hypothetical protein
VVFHHSEGDKSLGSIVSEPRSGTNSFYKFETKCSVREREKRL